MSLAVAAADGLADASEGTAGASSISYSLMDRYEMKKKKKGLSGGEPKQADGNGKSKAMGEEKVSKSSSGYFICEGKHFEKECPNRAQLSSISVERGTKEMTYGNPMCVLDG